MQTINFKKLLFINQRYICVCNKIYIMYNYTIKYCFTSDNLFKKQIANLDHREIT